MTRLFLNHKFQITQALLSSFQQQFPNVQSNPNAIEVQYSPQSPVITNKFNPDYQTVVQSVQQSDQCGVGNSVSPLIYGGEEVTRGEFPWLTAIYQKSAGLKFLCGGSLISSRTVLSAGHCFKISSLTANRLVVHIGHHNLENFSEQGFLVREIQNLIVHPQYNPNLLADADLAVLHLQQPVQ